MLFYNPWFIDDTKEMLSCVFLLLGFPLFDHMLRGPER